eukprot:14142152-Ditylum_brightwellii.AAC.1
MSARLSTSAHVRAEIHLLAGRSRGEGFTMASWSSPNIASISVRGPTGSLRGNCAYCFRYAHILFLLPAYRVATIARWSVA